MASPFRLLVVFGRTCGGKYAILSLLICVLCCCGVPSISLAAQAGDVFARPVIPLQDKRFAVFFEHLKTIAHQQDREAILQLVDEECEVSHGGFRGADGFRLYWFGTAAPGGDFFAKFADALALGGAFWGADQDYFVLPFTALAPAEDAQGALLGVTVCSKSNLRSAPGKEAPVIAVLDRQLVRYCSNRFVPYEVGGYAWVCLLNALGEPGFVVRECVRSPLDTAFVFRRTDAGWHLISCMAGTNTTILGVQEMNDQKKQPNQEGRPD